MRWFLLSLAVVFVAACGGANETQTVRGLAVSYAPGVEPYRAADIDTALQGVEMAYWHTIDWRSVPGVLVQEAPPCLANSRFYHQLAHALRGAYDGGPDAGHMDPRYWGRGAGWPLVWRVGAWYGVQFCPLATSAPGPGPGL